MSTPVLVLKPSSFGDIIHTLPAVAWIKDARPDWKIAWLVNTEWAPLLADNASIDEIVLFPRRTFRGMSGPGRFWRWIKREMRGRIGFPRVVAQRCHREGERRKIDLWVE